MWLTFFVAVHLADEGAAIENLGQYIIKMSFSQKMVQYLD
jgi:hypothetical protein